MKAVVPACMSVTFLVLFFLAHIAIGNPKPIQLKVRPLIAFAPSDAYLQVRVHPTPEDRWIVVTTDSGEFSRRSDWTIEPCQPEALECHDRTLYTFWWKDLPAGSYDITAFIGHDGTISASDRVTMQVQGRGEGQ